ncbi:BTB/POZ-like [Lasallia pustulata]|uniref:BTB/POZ-like n=1 Tax=Lasallia pustulata TaxID=136370 RepID=A0A1W5D4A8_9LECA|nr:BTB/POZ-like [Lasallia pustulata]
MFARRTYQSDSFSKHRAGKSTSKPKRSFRDHAITAKKTAEKPKKVDSPPAGSTLTSPIITLCVGPEQRLFAAHEDVLSSSPFFAAISRGQFLESTVKRVNLPEELPEVFSSVLEYLYKGDYYPRLLHNKRQNAWELEDCADNNGGRGVPESTVFHGPAQQSLLKDTLLYCAAERYGLDELKRLALRKQGLQSGIQCSTILASARYAYTQTPDSDSRLRAHYLALIIRSRSTFKRSGTMQMEMEAGGKLFFDLFVAMCNHMDDITSATKSPR